MTTAARNWMLSIAAVTVAMVGLGAGLATRSDGGAKRQITSDAAAAPSTIVAETTTTAPDEGRSADTDRPARAPKPTTTAVTVPTTAAPRPPAPADRSRPVALDSDSRLRVDGLGPVRIGMGLEEARAASGLPMVNRESPACTSFQTDGPPAGLSFTGVDGSDRLDLIVVSEPSVTTVSGIRVGSTLAEARRAYGEKLRGSVQDGWGKLVFRPEDASLDHLALALLFSDGRVAGMWAGLRVVVEADEICA